MIWQFVGDVNSYFSFVINRRNEVQSDGGASIPFAIGSSIINQNEMISETVSFCGSQTYQLFKYLTNVLKPLTESRHKLQSTENFIDAIKTIQIPDDPTSVL